MHKLICRMLSLYMGLCSFTIYKLFNIFSNLKAADLPILYQQNFLPKLWNWSETGFIRPGYEVQWRYSRPPLSLCLKLSLKGKQQWACEKSTAVGQRKGSGIGDNLLCVGWVNWWVVCNIHPQCCQSPILEDLTDISIIGLSIIL